MNCFCILKRFFVVFLRICFQNTLSCCCIFRCLPFTECLIDLFIFLLRVICNKIDFCVTVEYVILNFVHGSWRRRLNNIKFSGTSRLYNISEVDDGVCTVKIFRNLQTLTAYYKISIFVTRHD
jgi:hypothetical protein